MAVPPVKERIRPKRSTKTEPELIISNPTPISSDFNEDDYLAGRSSVGFVSQRIILTQNSLARESLAADRSSGNETHQRFNGSSPIRKASAKAEVNDGFMRDTTGRVRTTDHIKPSHAETSQLREKFSMKSDVGEKVNTKQCRNKETVFVNNHVKCATYVRPVNEERVLYTGTSHNIKSQDKGKLDSKANVPARRHVDEEVCTTLEVKKEKAYLKDEAKRSKDAEAGQDKTLHIRGTSKDTREATTSPKTNSKGAIQSKDNSDKACMKLDIKDGQKPDVKVGYPHATHCIPDETNVSSCSDEHKDNATEETTDTDKVYNYLFYIGTRIPSKSFSRLCRSVNRQTTSSSSSSPSSSLSSPSSSLSS